MKRPEQAGPPREYTGPRFEYKVFQKMTLLKSERKLNELGEEGWELVAIQNDSGFGGGGANYVFKREYR
jgi:hypothetical protein